MHRNYRCIADCEQSWLDCLASERQKAKEMRANEKLNLNGEKYDQCSDEYLKCLGDGAEIDCV